MSKHALITGITGQDGSYLAELLLEKGYEVYGLMRRKSVVDYGNVDHIKEKIHFIYADMTDEISLIRAMQISQADEVYNLAAQSFVATSWEQPMATAEIDALGVTKMLEAIKFVKPSCRFYQASTSENVRSGAGNAADGKNSVLSEKPVRRCKAVWSLDYQELSGELQPVCLLRYPVQP